jgi:hypothetical protein
MGSSPGNLVPVQVSLPVGHPKAAELSAGVSGTRSPPLAVDDLQPPWKVWYSPSQWPTCVVVGGRGRGQGTGTLWGVADSPQTGRVGGCKVKCEVECREQVVWVTGPDANNGGLMLNRVFT